MVTRVYRSHDLSAALAQVRTELGSEAIILGQEQLRGRWWWPFRRDRWQIIAADHGNSVDWAGADERAGQLEANIAEMRASLSRLIAAADLVHLPRTTQAIVACYERLVSRGMAPELAQELVLAARDELSSTAQRETSIVESTVRRQLEQRVRSRPPQPVQGSGPLVVFLLGQTGVGKTTTLIKLATQQKLEGRQVAIINIDVVRPASGTQIEAMARTLYLDVDLAYDAITLESALARHADKAIVFVDTPGSAHRDAAQIQQLVTLTQTAPRRQSFLVMACNTPLQEMQQIVRGYRDIGLNGLVLTKADETEALGMAVTLACQSDVPVAYLSNGRRIPEDILPGTPACLASLMFDTQARAIQGSPLVRTHKTKQRKPAAEAQASALDLPANGNREPV